MEGQIELVSCPFCGCADIDVSFSKGFFAGEEDQPIISAGCNNCGVCGPSVHVPDSGNGHAESAAAWNNQYSVHRLKVVQDDLDRANRVMCAMASDLGEIVHLLGGDEHSLALPLVRERLTGLASKKPVH